MFEIASELEKKNLPFALVTIIRTNNIEIYLWTSDACIRFWRLLI